MKKKILYTSLFPLSYLVLFSALYFTSFIGELLTVFFSMPGFILANLFTGKGFWSATHNLPPDNPFFGVFLKMIIYAFFGYFWAVKIKNEK